ncbi:13276_t:CDS:2, partial [Acaulospora colombiana]
MSATLSPNASPKQYPFLTRQEFEFAAKLFIAQSRKASETEVWNWVEHEKFKGFGYLCRRSMVQKLAGIRSLGEGISVDEENDVFEDDDPSVLSTLSSSEEYLTVDYHVIYSTSYKVPVLYFNVYYDDGTPLKIDEIYSNLVQPSRFEDIKPAGFYGGISQQDHPTLLIPFYFLHPCETATLMRTIVGTNANKELDGGSEGKLFNVNEESLVENNNGYAIRDFDISSQKIALEGYIRSWLSLIGPVVGVKVGIG